MSPLQFFSISAFSIISLQAPVHAAVQILFTEVGEDVVISYSGSINTASLSPGLGSSVASHGFNGTFQGVGGVYNFEASTADGWLLPSGFSATGSIGNIGFQVADAFEGDDFSVNHNGLNTLELPSGYVSGSTISGSITYFDETLSSLGINTGNNIASWTFGSGLEADSINFSAVVPEASAYPLFLSLLAFTVASFRRAFRRN